VLQSEGNGLWAGCGEELKYIVILKFQCVYDVEWELSQAMKLPHGMVD
jgi:hypothetical protein